MGLIAELKARREISTENTKKFYDYILEHGTLFMSKHGFEKGRELAIKHGFHPLGFKQCVYNSQMFAVSGSKTKYFEGYACRTLGILANMSFEHAWNVINGKVVDLTWPDGDEYFGLEIPVDFIRKNIIKTGWAEMVLQKYVYEQLKNGGEI